MNPVRDRRSYGVNADVVPAPFVIPAEAGIQRGKLQQESILLMLDSRFCGNDIYFFLRKSASLNYFKSTHYMKQSSYLFPRHKSYSPLHHLFSKPHLIFDTANGLYFQMMDLSYRMEEPD